MIPFFTDNPFFRKSDHGILFLFIILLIYYFALLSIKESKNMISWINLNNKQKFQSFFRKFGHGILFCFIILPVALLNKKENDNVVSWLKFNSKQKRNRNCGFLFQIVFVACFLIQDRIIEIKHKFINHFNPFWSEFVFNF